MKPKILILMVALLGSANLAGAERNHLPRHWITKAVITTRIADIVTTKIALARPGTYEANPLFGRQPSMGRMILTEAALGVAFWGMSKGITELGHPGIAKGLLVGSAIAEGAVSIHNAEVHGRMK